MPAKSKQQQKFMGLVHAFKKGEVPASKVSKAVKDAAKSMSKKSVKKYAQTDHDDLPKKVTKEKIKAENLVIEFGKSFQKFTRAVHMLGKGITKMKGDKTDERIIQKAFKKHIIPFGWIIDSWNTGQQKNPHINEGRYHAWRNDDSMTPKQKIGMAMRETRDNLTELERVVKYNVKLKNELNVDSRSYWKNTHKALNKISERLVKLANKVGQLQ